MSRSYYVIFNANAGTALGMGLTADRLQEEFSAAGLNATINADVDEPMEQRIAKAIASDAEVIVAAGGDGTITTVANAIIDTTKILAILPLGTVNALAKDMHIPLATAEAVAALGRSEIHKIDAGEVNGRVFLHKVVVGLVPAMAAGREFIRGRESWGARLALLRYFARRIVRTRRMAVAIEMPDGERRVERIHSLAVASNEYDEAFGHLLSRARLDTGTLTLYVFKHLNFPEVLRLAGGMVLGRWRDAESLRLEKVKSVTIDSHKRLLKVMFDGDVRSLETPLHFRIRPQALAVLVPPEAEGVHDVPAATSLG
ncbi:MAG TPA: diacylglycerol kinase family protein [Devosia sp.]|jgi:diacylglycerol kinase family enzyme|nr:diacylglycerol kinase family protein [Devosia sp.]